jgi:hypothetical protein
METVEPGGEAHRRVSPISAGRARIVAFKSCTRRQVRLCHTGIRIEETVRFA